MDIRSLVRALLAYDALTARQWVMDFARAGNKWSSVAAPTMSSDEELALAASIVEMMAERANEEAPPWTSTVSENQRDVYLVRAAQDMPRLRALCEAEGPEPLRRRHFFAPPDFLTHA